jgi:hypothetical protein
MVSPASPDGGAGSVGLAPDLVTHGGRAEVLIASTWWIIWRRSRRALWPAPLMAGGIFAYGRRVAMRGGDSVSSMLWLGSACVAVGVAYGVWNRWSMRNALMWVYLPLEASKRLGLTVTPIPKPARFPTMVMCGSNGLSLRPRRRTPSGSPDLPAVDLADHDLRLTIVCSESGMVGAARVYGPGFDEHVDAAGSVPLDINVR